MTDKERFKGVNGYAPATIGAPQYTNAPNFAEFKKSKEEKIALQNMKAAHKRELLKAYPEGVGRHINVPKRELPQAMKWQF